MNIFFIILLVILLISVINCIILIPFKVFTKKEPDNFTASDVIYNWGEEIIYSNIKIGNPPQNISIIINSKNFESNLYEHMCDISGSFYDKNKSNSFYIEKELNDKEKRINETIYFYDNLNLKELKPFKYFKLKYSDNGTYSEQTYEYQENTCIKMGFKLNYVTFGESDYNLIKQLKNNYNILETFDFSFKYTSQNEGQIIIGSEPHIYDPNNYYENRYRVAPALKPGKDSLYREDFFINLDKIYYSYTDKNTGEAIKENLNETYGRIHFDMGVILGPGTYKKLIIKDFFEDLFNEKKCFLESVIDKQSNYEYQVFYCDKKLTENIIKNKFPTLYFEMKIFNKVFELTYKDLFREKNGKLYFLIYFKKNDSFENFFLMGSIFLKKYFFTFNQDTKMIGYYKEDINNDNKQNDNSIFSILKNKYVIFLMIILVIIFCLLGFFLGKIVYDKVRKKRLNEMDDNYDYFPQETNNNKNDNKDNNNDNNDNNILIKMKINE